MRVRVLGSVLALLLAAGSGCFLKAASSKIETGEKIETGKKRFDDYFASVGELRDAAQSAKVDLFPIREPLWEELGLPVEVSIVDLMQETRRRAAKFRDYGVIMNLRLTPTPKVLTVRGELQPDAKDEKLIQAVEESAIRAMQAYKQLSEMMALAYKLDAQRPALAEEAERLRADDGNRALVERELVAAGRVLEATKKKLEDTGERLALYTIELMGAVDTGAADTVEEQCEQLKLDAKERAEQAKNRPPPPPPPPARAPPRPGPPAPPRPQPGGDDFEM
ncbi:MAG: hypothetical protein HY744_03545 [Deltaproteobacteria bacterium]|nr:hypothetical protein [Deltaproteobacteria bacterium]